MKNKIGIVIEREFSTRVQKKSFILLTLLMPIIIISLCMAPALLANISSDDAINIAVVDNTGKYYPMLKDNGNLHFNKIEKMTDEIKKKDGDYNAIIVIDNNLSTDSTAATIFSHSEVPIELTRYFNSVVEQSIRDDRMASFNIPNLDEIISKCHIEYSVRTIKWDKDGEENLSDSTIAGVVGIIFTLLVYMFVLSYGGMVMQGVTEEKTNRIMEIMVSSIKPFQLMMGKIIGIALVGIVQFIIWGILIGIGILAIGFVLKGDVDAETAQNFAQGMTQGITSTQPVPNSPGTEFLQILQGLNLIEIATMFLLYFIGGYLLYASIFAAAGASVNEPGDTQQFMTPIICIFIFGLYAGMFSMQNPDGPLAFWCSFIPLTSPMVMMVRLPFGVPFWQLAVSLILLFGTSFAVVWLSAKIYRVGILMYGKKPTFREMIRWIKFK